jgi:hypothetical protein
MDRSLASPCSERSDLQSDIENSRFYESSLISDVGYKTFQWVSQCITELDWGTYTYLKKFIKMCKPYFAKHDSYLY